MTVELVMVDGSREGCNVRFPLTFTTNDLYGGNTLPFVDEDANVGIRVIVKVAPKDGSEESYIVKTFKLNTIVEFNRL